MKVSILQRNIEWGDVTLNIERADEAIDRNAGSDLYVLPEMFSTGFCTQPKQVAEQEGGTALQWMQRKAAQIGAAIAGSVVVKEDDRYYNRFYFVTPDGNVTRYDKHHLFTYGGEHHHFTAGNERCVVEYKGVRIMLQICYDLRFPVWVRNRGDYDMIIYVASWPIPRIDAWRSLLLARAIENQCYVVGVNRVGSDPSCEYCGGSVVIDPYGKYIAKCPDFEETEASAEIDMTILNDFRAKFPVLRDADI